MFFKKLSAIKSCYDVESKLLSNDIFKVQLLNSRSSFCRISYPNAIIESYSVNIKLINNDNSCTSCIGIYFRESRNIQHS